MKILTPQMRQFCQGDTCLTRVASIPKDAKPVDRKGKPLLIVTRSDSGHHHAIREPNAQLFDHPNDPLISFLEIEAEHADLEHLRSYDTHETVRIMAAEDGPTCIEVRRQREHTPEGWRRVED